MSEGLETFRVPMVVFTETPGVDERDAARRAERLILGAFQRSGTLVTSPRGVILRDARNTMSLVVVGVEELNTALRNNNFEVLLREAAPMFRERG